MSDIGFFSSLSKYDTPLTSKEKKGFGQWVKEKKVLLSNDYDMQGFWKALKNEDPRAISAVDEEDKMIHYPDIWKKPSHPTFSDESIYATGENKKRAGRWAGGEMYIPTLYGGFNL